MKKQQKSKGKNNAGFDSYIKTYSTMNYKVFFSVSFLNVKIGNCIKIKLISLVLLLKQV